MTTLVVVLVLGSAPNGSQTFAAETAADTSSPAGQVQPMQQALQKQQVPQIHQLLIPVDPQRQHVGREVYVPEALYRLLQDEPSEATVDADWLVTGMRLRGRLTDSVEHRRYECGRWTLSIDVESLRPFCTLRLPLAQG